MKEREILYKKQKPVLDWTIEFWIKFFWLSYSNDKNFFWGLPYLFIDYKLIFPNSKLFLIIMHHKFEKHYLLMSFCH